MEAFEYTSIDNNGKQLKGIIQADNEKQARQLLRNKHLTPIQLNLVVESGIEQQINSSSGLKTQRISLKKSELPLLIRQLATLVQAGLPLDEALKTFIEQSESFESGDCYLEVNLFQFKISQKGIGEYGVFRS